MEIALYNEKFIILQYVMQIALHMNVQLTYVYFLVNLSLFYK